MNNKFGTTEPCRVLPLLGATTEHVIKVPAETAVHSTIQGPSLTQTEACGPPVSQLKLDKNGCLQGLLKFFFISALSRAKEHVLEFE